ncbi:IS110 family transposase [Streptomyces asiaticus]
MDVIVARCAGLDVHRDTAVATVRSPGKRRGSRHQETRTFPTTLRGLAQLGDWLMVEQVELVGMEATGIYWKPVFAALEDRLICWLLNAAHMHNVPGRKTDVAETRHGSPSCWNTGWCGLHSFRRRRCGTFAT